MGKTMLKPEEVADMLGVHRSQVMRLIKFGKLKAVNVGAGKTFCYRIQKDEVEKFINKDHVKPDTEN